MSRASAKSGSLGAPIRSKATSGRLWIQLRFGKQSFIFPGRMYTLRCKKSAQSIIKKGKKMLQQIGVRGSKTGLFIFLFVCLSGLAVAQAPTNLVVNGSFENRTSPPPPASGFSSGVPDSWTSLIGGNTYLVHESHTTVPGNAAIDGQIIVGGGGNIVLSQTITTVGAGPLQVTWWANNETSAPRPDTDFYSTAVQFNDSDGNFIAWSELRDNFDPDELTWSEESYTTSVEFTPGTYEVQIFIGGLSSADDLVVTQSMQSVPVPTLSAASLVLLALVMVVVVAARQRRIRAVE